MTDTPPPIPDPAATAASVSAPAGPPAGPQAPAYGAPGYGQPQPYAQPAYGPRTNTLAIISLVASLVGLFAWILAPIAGVILGHIALSQIKRTGEGGRTLAIVGTIIGYALIGLQVIGAIVYVIFLITVVNTYGNGGNIVM